MEVLSNMNKLYKNNIRLNDIQGVNRLLARVTNALVQDEISEDRARTIGYLANILIRGLEKGDLEQRLEELEKGLPNNKRVG